MNTIMYIHAHVNTYKDITTVPATCTHIHMAPLKVGLPTCLSAGLSICLGGVTTSLCASSGAVTQATSALCCSQKSRAKPIFSRCTWFIRVNVERMDPSPYD